MKSVIEQLKVIENLIIKEKGENLYFLGLIKRYDLDNKWDLLVIADWIAENNSHSDLEYLIIALKKHLGSEFSVIEDILTISPTALLSSELKKAFDSNEIELYKESQIYIFDDVKINLIAISKNFQKIKIYIDKELEEEINLGF